MNRNNGQKKNKKQNGGNRSNRNRTSNAITPLPPTFQNKIKVTHRFRFIANSAGPTNWSFQDLMSIICAGQVLTVSSISIISACKLKKLFIWSTGPISATTSNSIGFEPQFAGALGASPMGAEPILLTDTSYNADKVAKLCYIPTPGTPFSSWQNVVSTSATTGANTFMTSSQNVGDTMDIIMTFILNVTDIALQVNNTASAAPGVLKQFGLPNSSPQWIQIPM
jgi:hypothetical protein